MADSTAGLTMEYTYEPFGGSAATSVSPNPFQFSGRENDGTGLYFYRARYYDPRRGRFVQSDPLGLAGGINPYAYAGGNPVMWGDPLGLVKVPGPTRDPLTGWEVGRFAGTEKGNTMIVPNGGGITDYPLGSKSPDTHTTYPNGSNYQRLNREGHPWDPTAHGHGHLEGKPGPTGPETQGPSIDTSGNVVPRNSPEAHWPARPRPPRPKVPSGLPGILPWMLSIPALIDIYIDMDEIMRRWNDPCYENLYCT